MRGAGVLASNFMRRAYLAQLLMSLGNVWISEQPPGSRRLLGQVTYILVLLVMFCLCPSPVPCRSTLVTLKYFSFLKDIIQPTVTKEIWHGQWGTINYAMTESFQNCSARAHIEMLGLPVICVAWWVDGTFLSSQKGLRSCVDQKSNAQGRRDTVQFCLFVFAAK